MFAIIETGGKQYRVQEGAEVYIEKLDGEAGAKVTFDKVLLVAGETSHVGTPYVEGATVTGKIEKQGKQKKVTIFKYRPKKDSSTKQGHRQPYTKVTIDSIKVK